MAWTRKGESWTADGVQALGGEASRSPGARARTARSRRHAVEAGECGRVYGVDKEGRIRTADGVRAPGGEAEGSARARARRSIPTASCTGPAKAGGCMAWTRTGGSLAADGVGTAQSWSGPASAPGPRDSPARKSRAAAPARTAMAGLVAGGSPRGAALRRGLRASPIPSHQAGRLVDRAFRQSLPDSHGSRTAMASDSCQPFQSAR